MKQLIKNKHFAYPLTCWLLVCVWFIFGTLNAFDGLKDKTKDWFTQNSVIANMNRRLDKDIIIVVVDDVSLANSALKWPWKRSYFAELINKIGSDQPAVVGMDFIFSGNSTEFDDDALSRSLANVGNVVIAESRRIDGESLAPMSSFSEAAKAVAYVNKINDDDGVVRSASVYLKDETVIHYSFEMQILANYLDRNIATSQIKDNFVYLSDKVIPVDSTGQVAINYTNDLNGYAIVSAHDVFSGKTPKGTFKDKIVLVGASAQIIHDIISTPLGPIPGVFVLANTISMTLNESFLKQCPVVLDVMIVLIFGGLLLYINRKKGFLLGFVAFVLLAAAWFASMLYLRVNAFQMGFFTQGFLISAAFVVSNIYKYSYLMYISAKLKNLAIADPVTGFYSIRYLTLILDQKLKSKEPNLSLVSMGIREYKMLGKRYGFEEMKSFMRGFARFLETQLKHKLKKPLLARAHGGNFYLLVSGVDREELKSYLDDLMHQVWSSGFSFGDEAEMIHLSVAVAYTSVYQGVSGKYMYSRAEEELVKSVDRNEDVVAMINVHEKIWDIDRSEGVDDELEFLSVDIEERNRELEEALKETENVKRDVEHAYFAVVMSLVNALEEKDPYTQGHSTRAAENAKAIAKQVGMTDEECDRIYKAGLLHDIGKIGVPESVLHKKGRLTDEDFAMIKKHPVMGKKILEPIKAFEDILPMVLFHHEKYDGTGYPHGLHADTIPVGAQILAVADCFDAITCGRGYKHGSSQLEGMKELERCSGTQFNPLYVEAFKKVLNL